MKEQIRQNEQPTELDTMTDLETNPNDSQLPKKITKETLQPKDPKKAVVSTVLKSTIYVIISAFLIALPVHCLIGEHNNFTIGGAAGLAAIIASITNGFIPKSVASFLINSPLLVIAFFFVKRKFAILSVSNILLQSLFLFLFEQLNVPLITFNESATIFAAIASGVCVGTAVALAFKIGGSTGGVDILAVIIQKKFPAPSIARMIFAVNAVIIGASFFVFYESENSIAANLMPIMLALFEAYSESKTNDSITNGFQSAIEFRIITDKPEEMSLALMRELSRGVTSVPATGMYTHEQHAMLICVINRRQVTALQKIMKKIDPNAFAVMTNVSQVLGLGFFSSEN